MKRRDFLKSVSGLAVGALAPTAPAIFSPAKADPRSETLLIVSEGGPNNLDIHGVGTNVPGYEVSWNCYDRLISHEMKSGPGGVPYYDRDKFKPELAEDMKVGDMSVTFKLRKNAKFHDGTPVTAKDVKWSLDRAVSDHLTSFAETGVPSWNLAFFFSLNVTDMSEMFMSSASSPLNLSRS